MANEELNLYQNVAKQQRVEHVVAEHALLVKQIAYQLLSRLPSSVQLDDLVQAGMVGLLEASQRYDPDKNASFATFASIRIRGAMLDELRKMSWMPRSAHQHIRQIAKAIKQVENRTGKAATSREIAAELEVSMDEYYAMSSEVYANDLQSFDSTDERLDATLDDDEITPHCLIQQADYEQYLASIIENFPEREKILLQLYYTEKLSFREIAEVIGVTEARVCQLHGQILARLKARLHENDF